MSNGQELSEAVDLFDQKGDRTVLNIVLGLFETIMILLGFISVVVSIMKNVVESLDDDSVTNEDSDMEKQSVITIIEIELAELVAVNG